jgi:hypothetical protein
MGRSPKLSGARFILPSLAFVIFTLGALNFLWFVSEDVRLRGELIAEDRPINQCWLQDRGVERVVLCTEWDRHRFHSATVGVTHLLAMASAGWLLFGSVFPYLMGLRGGSSLSQRERVLQESGPPLVVDFPAGQVGGVRFTVLVVRMQVFPGGVRLKPLFMPPAVILATEITGLEVHPHRLGNTELRIQHSSPDLRSPLLIKSGPESPMARALAQITGLPLRSRGGGG